MSCVSNIAAVPIGGATVVSWNYTAVPGSYTATAHDGLSMDDGNPRRVVLNKP
jgi:hypothetical protein